MTWFDLKRFKFSKKEEHPHCGLNHWSGSENDALGVLTWKKISIKNELKEIQVFEIITCFRKMFWVKTTYT